MVWVGEHGVAGQLGGEPQVALLKEVLRLGHRRIHAAEGLHIPCPGPPRWVLPQGAGLASVPAEVALVDGLDV